MLLWSCSCSRRFTQDGQRFVYEGWASALHIDTLLTLSFAVTLQLSLTRVWMVRSKQGGQSAAFLIQSSSSPLVTWYLSQTDLAKQFKFAKLKSCQIAWTNVEHKQNLDHYD